MTDLTDDFTLYDNGYAVFVIPYPMNESIGQTPRHLVERYGYQWNVCSYVPPEYNIPYGAIYKCFSNFTEFKVKQKEFELNEKRASLNREIRAHRLALEQQIVNLERQLATRETE